METQTTPTLEELILCRDRTAEAYQIYVGKDSAKLPDLIAAQSGCLEKMALALASTDGAAAGRALKEALHHTQGRLAVEHRITSTLADPKINISDLYALDYLRGVTRSQEKASWKTYDLEVKNETITNDSPSLGLPSILIILAFLGLYLFRRFRLKLLKEQELDKK